MKLNKKNNMLKFIIIFQILFLNARNPGIIYEYSLPKSTLTDYKPNYFWEFTSWSECDANCGGGTMITMPSCIEENNGIVSDHYCNDILRPSPKARICNEHPCVKKWRVSQWSVCSACKGHKGEKIRKVQCVIQAAHSNDDDVEVDLKNCKGPQPTKTMKCEGTKPCAPLCHKKPKISKRKMDNSPTSEKFTPVNSNHIYNLNNNMRLTRYLEKAEDEHLNKNHKAIRENKNTKDELRKILHEWTLKHNDKRMCGEHFMVDVETKMSDIMPKETTKKIELNSNRNEIQVEINTTPTELNYKMNTDELTTVSVTESYQEESITTEGDTEIKSLSTLEPGTLIKDEYPLDQAVLLEAPIKADSIKANLSDIAYQDVGDSISLQLDTSQAKIYTGPEARERLNEMAYGNVTDITEPPYDDIIAENPAEP